MSQADGANLQSDRSYWKLIPKQAGLLTILIIFRSNNPNNPECNGTSIVVRRGLLWVTPLNKFNTASYLGPFLNCFLDELLTLTMFGECSNCGSQIKSNANKDVLHPAAVQLAEICHSEGLRTVGHLFEALAENGNKALAMGYFIRGEDFVVYGTLSYPLLHQGHCSQWGWQPL